MNFETEKTQEKNGSTPSCIFSFIIQALCRGRREYPQKHTHACLRIHECNQSMLTSYHHENLYNIDPLKPHFYTVKLGFTGVYIIFLISAQKHRLWVLVRTASPRRF